MSALDWLELRRSEQLHPQAWRNGGGQTLELARGGADPDSPDWRVSCAWIAAPARYSHFPGLQRVQVLLDGGPLALTGPEGPIAHLVAPGSRTRFAGDIDVSATVEAPCRVLNGFARPDAFEIDAWLRPLLGAMLLPPSAGGRWIGYLLGGSLKLRCGAAQLLLARGDCFCIDDRAQPRVILDGGGSLALAQVRVRN